MTIDAAREHEREFGALIEATKNNERAIIALTSTVEAMRRENTASHNNTDNRIGEMGRSLGALEQRISDTEKHHNSAITWTIAIAGFLVMIGIASLGWSDRLNWQVASVIARTTTLEQERSADAQDQRASTAELRSDVANENSAIIKMKQQLDDLQRCIATRRGC